MMGDPWSDPDAAHLHILDFGCRAALLVVKGYAFYRVQ